MLLTSRRNTAGALALAFLVVAVIVILRQEGLGSKGSFASCGGGGSRADLPIRRGEWPGGRGPYGIGLYDSPHYYPYYESRDVMGAWDGDGRCVSYCRASGDGGCAVACR